MPTYEYACTSCGHQFEIIQSFSDDALTACPECQGPLRKVFGSVGIVFKGSGFYKNDSRGSTSSTTPSTPAAASPSSDSSSSDSSSSESSSVKKSDSTSSGSSTPAASE